MKNQYVVIGLGRFGSSLAQTLMEQEQEVLVIDKDIDIINHAASYATQAVQMDATDEQALEAAGIGNFDTACVCTGDVQSSIMITLLCKELGAQNVLAKAGSDLHEKMLLKMGADRVVFPERDSGVRQAMNLVSSNILDFIQVSDDFGIAEFETGREWAGKSLAEMRFRQNYGVNVVAVKPKAGKININPKAQDILTEHDVIVVLGREEALQKLEKIAEKR
ncbi:TrkA family potassium uptake protein [Christensenellaceae bacterium OttesenSCG-928-K19]|nr:TrkA family potassium uptake protein [Christensenellaceae bacterium OttesenSCG-928-K19]